MQQQVIELFANKLADALKATDEVSLTEVRDIWKTVGPSPSCPYVGDLTRNIQYALARGHVARNGVVNKLASETAASYPSLLSPSFIDRLMQVVDQQFQKDHLVESAKSTEGIYQRRLAPKTKFDPDGFASEFSLIQASAANSARQTIARVRTLLEDACLKHIASRVHAASVPKEKIVSQTNNHFHGFITGKVNVAGESIYNTKLSLSIGQLVAEIDASSGTLAEKAEAKSLLGSFLAHPLV